MSLGNQPSARAAACLARKRFMGEHILVTGGAGFIGSYIVDALIEQGCRVRVIDLLAPQVHPDGPPGYLNSEAEYIWGDLQDEALVDRALDGIDVVIHQAAAVGVGQSMYAIRHYAAANVLGTATLLERITRRSRPLQKLIVASSMSVYGDGAYLCRATQRLRYPQKRSVQQMEARAWEMRDEETGSVLEPVPIAEDAPLRPTSVYAITKRDQEELCLSIGQAYGIPTVAFRYFGVYGPRQALSNPYTGLMVIFASRLLNGKPPLIFEDGQQIRDFIHVSDVAQANLRALSAPVAGSAVYNLARGEPVRVLDVARRLCQLMHPELEPEISNLYRKGDVRHCYADVAKLHGELGFVPRVTLEQGLTELVAWAQEQIAVDRLDSVTNDLRRRQLIV
jgi:dTDP-L-rhamnose 4-epimerase